MTSLFLEDGSRKPATALHVEDCRVVAVRRKEQDGYWALQLGAGHRRASRVNKAEQGAATPRPRCSPAETLAEFRLDNEEGLLEVGRKLRPAHFVAGQRVDVSGTTSGKGFAGSMKRYGFGGGRASHGTSVSHRAHGSTGQHQDPGRVFKNKKMAGHMGVRRRTAQNLKVLQVDDEGRAHSCGGLGARGSRELGASA